ncbi:hypothetical protein GHT06_019826 [Daphnia sinensis]|uniref:Uncharacterized protein n=1 Tax=Daphnia sinensis TaxID=1820382 RepID=A0AAD5LBD7_9CRUS|nr:hypothetical protein GHT06_019826 [Daphnia sinensis]
MDCMGGLGGYSDIEIGTGKWDAHDLAKRSSYCPIIILILSLVLSFVIITKHVIINDFIVEILA